MDGSPCARLVRLIRKLWPAALRNHQLRIREVRFRDRETSMTSGPRRQASLRKTIPGEAKRRCAPRIRWRIQLHRESLEGPREPAPGCFVGSDQSLAQKRERCTSAALEHDQRVAQLAFIGAQESPSRAIGQATVSDRRRQRARFGDRSYERQEAGVERRGRIVGKLPCERGQQAHIRYICAYFVGCDEQTMIVRCNLIES